MKALNEMLPKDINRPADCLEQCGDPHGGKNVAIACGIEAIVIFGR